MTLKLDDLAKGFLGTADPKQVTVTQAQKANPTRQQALYERELLAEACDFGDTLVTYVTAHPALSFVQRAFGMVLGLLNLRRDYPDGTKMFDDLVDLGGADLKLPPYTVPADPPLPWTFATEELEVAAKFAETFVNYVTLKKQGLGLSNPQGVYGLGRAFHTLRHGFPKTDDGPRGFDYCAQLAGEYFGRG